MVSLLHILIVLTLDSTASLLKSVHEYGGPHFKRFVLLGTASILNCLEDTSVTGDPYSEKDWDPVIQYHHLIIPILTMSQITPEIAIEKQNPLLGYCAAKTQGEKEAWKFLEDNKTSFDMTVLNPDVIIGPMLHNVSKPEKVNETNKLTIYNFLNGTRTGTEAWELPFYRFVCLRFFFIGVPWNPVLTYGRSMCETFLGRIFYL